MIAELIASTPQAVLITIQETFSSFRLIYSCPVNSPLPIETACAALQEISARDTFELLIEAGDSLLKFNDLPVDLTPVAAFFEEARELGDINIDLNIKKNKIDNAISVYSVSALEKYITSAKLSSILQALSSILEEAIHFEVKENTTEFHTQTISFSRSRTSAALNFSERKLQMASIKENTSFSGVQNLALLPNDFHIQLPREELPLQKFCMFLCGLLALASLCNVSQLNQDDKFSIRMYGYKAIALDNLDRNYLLENSAMLYKIYRWVYDTDTVTDRLGLARNVISLHLGPNGLPVLNAALWDAIHSNYQIYLKGNIESYLEVKGKIAELLLETIEKTNQFSENLLDSLKNNVLIILTFLLTVVVINGVKDMSVAAVFSIPYLIVTTVLILCSCAWLILIRRDAEERFNAASASLADVLHTNYAGVLLTDEINRSLQPAITKNKTQLTRQLNKYSSWWKWMLGLFALIYYLGYVGFILFDAKNNKPSATTEKKANEHKVQSSSAPELLRPTPKKHIAPEM